MKVSKQFIKTLCLELLREIRGQRTQGMVSQRMGYDFNQCYRWESGRTRMKWGDFVRYCKVCKVDLKTALERGLIYFDHPDRAAHLLRHLIGKRTLLEVSQTLAISRFSLQDWASGKSDPPLDEMLKIFKYFDGLVFFVELLIGEGMIPCLSAEYTMRKKQLQVFYENPLCGAILMSFGLKSYSDLPKHRDGFIAEKLGISLEDEKMLLKKLVESGALEFKNGKYQKPSEQVSVRGNFEREKHLRSFWVRKGLEIDQNRPKPSDKSNFGFAIFSVTDDQEKRIRQALMDFAATINKIAREQSTGGDRLNVFTVQLYNPADGNLT